MWTPLHAGLGGTDTPQINAAPEDGAAAQLEELLASLTWFDRILLRVGIRWLRRIAITIIGLTVVLVGIIMIVAPGPATLVIPIGLAILGLEYAWARRLLRRLRGYVDAGITHGSALLGWKTPLVPSPAGTTPVQPPNESANTSQTPNTSTSPATTSSP